MSVSPENCWGVWHVTNQDRRKTGKEKIPINLCFDTGHPVEFQLGILGSLSSQGPSSLEFGLKWFTISGMQKLADVTRNLSWRKILSFKISRDPDKYYFQGNNQHMSKKIWCSRKYGAVIKNQLKQHTAGTSL